MPGPVPKRSDQRRRRNKPEPGAEIVKAAAGDEPLWLEPSETWHPIAREWYCSLAASGQSQFYEASDIATAFYVAEAMSRNLQATREKDKETGEWVTVGRFSAQLFASVMSAMTDLLTTEGARRRARVELERGPAPAEPASITALDEYRKAAGQ